MIRSNSSQSWKFDDNIFFDGAQICCIYNGDEKRAQTRPSYLAKSQVARNPFFIPPKEYLELQKKRQE